MSEESSIPKKLRKVGRRPYFERVHKLLSKHSFLIHKAFDRLKSDWASFCFVKILNCNASESCSFVQSYCKTIRNIQDSDIEKQGVVLIEDIFNIDLVEMFLDEIGDVEDHMTDAQLTAFERLANFLDIISDTNKILKKMLRDSALKADRWATVVGTHVLKKLAAAVEVTIDTEYSNSLESVECGCGCTWRAPFRIGDISMGHARVWHGTVDMLVGSVAVTFPKISIEEEIFVDDSDILQEKGRLEDARHQLIPQSITLSLAKRGGIDPLLAISKEDFKIFMYNPDKDLLYESTEFPLFEEPITGKQIHMPSILALWLVINCSYFFTGVKSSHEELGYKTNLRLFLDEDMYNIYQNHLRIGGLRHIKGAVSVFKAGANMGQFKQIS